jgi:hypothetical protein
MFPATAEAFIETYNEWMESTWILFASGRSSHGQRLTLKVQPGKEVAAVHHGDDLLHKGDLDYALRLFHQNLSYRDVDDE